MRQKMRFRGHLLLLVLWFGVEVCNARPQTRGEPNTEADSPAPSSGGARLTNEERAFFAPGSWQPIPSQFSGLVIDEAPSRVRVEKYDSSLRDARSKDQHVATPPVVDTPTNATDNTTTRGKSPTPLGDAIKMVASQLLQSRGAVAESDVRAPPPKAKQQESQPSKLHKQQKVEQREEEEEEEMSHGGVAIPVIIEEAETVATPSTTTRKTTTQTPQKKTQSTTKKQQAATTKKPTPASLRHPVTSIPDGLTTWVFLSGSSAAGLVATTPSPTLSTRLSTKATATTTKKTTTTTTTPSEKTSHNIVKKPSPLFTSSGTKPNRMTKKPVAAEETSTIKNKNKEATSTENKPTASRLEEGVAFRRRPVSTEIEAIPSTTTFKPFPTAYPLSTAAAVTSDEGSAEVSSSEEDNNSTEIIAEDATTTPKPKKKKKNKNKRRRRPVVKPQEEEEEDDYAELQSKIEGEEEDGLTKTPVKGKPARPLTTRIYNYLAREIMPSVGVGLIGLVGLAGLAGLIMYPFGGGALPIRRNYNTAAAAPKPNYYYYENEDGGQSEEEVLGKVLAGMKDPSYVVGGAEQTSYNEPESRTPIQQGEAYTRYDVGHQEAKQQPIRNDYDVSGRIPSSAIKNRRRQEDEVEYESEVAGSRVSGGVRVGGGSHYEVQPKEAVIQGSVHSEETHYGSEASRSPAQNRGSQRLGEGEGVAAPQASALYATRNEPRPVFNNDWSMVKTDAQEAVSTNDNNNHHEVKYGGGDADAVYGQSAQREERYGYESPQYSGVSRVGVGQKRTVEHGPRRLKRDVIKKDSAKEDLAENEIIDLEVSDEPVYSVERVHVEENDNEDEQKVTKAPKKDLGLTLKKTTPTKLDADTTTEGTDDVITDSSESNTSSDNSNESTDESSDKRIDSVETTTRNVVTNDVIVDDETTTRNVVTNDVIVNDETTSPPLDVTTSTEENITLETESPEDPSLVGLIRRVAQYKIRLGLSFLRNTSQAFSRYLEGMQKRVEEIVKENAKNRNRLQKRKSAHEEYY